MMVDRVAKALYAFENGSTDGWNGPLLQERGREMWRQYARAAIAAMRKPTGDMVNAGAADFPIAKDYRPDEYEPAAKQIYTAMIDAALEPVDA